MAPRTRDSSGVEIIEYAEIPPYTADLALDSLPFFEIGGLRQNPEEEFDSRTPFLAPVKLSDGRIAVNDRASIKFFDSTGTFLGSAGRSGSGPGEFQQIRKLCRLPGDTLLAIDYSDGRLSLWSPTGELVRAFARSGELTSDPCFRDGTLITKMPSVQSDATGDSPDRLTAEYARTQLDGTVLSRVGRFPLDQYYGPVFRTVSIVAGDDMVYVGDAETFEVREYTPSGDLVRILRAAEPPTAITDDNWRETIARTIPRNVPADQREAQIGRAMARPRPEAFPAYSSIRVGPAGRIWIQRYEDAHAWTVFDSAGKLLGTLTLTDYEGNRVELAAVNANEITLLRHDADGAAELSYFHLRLPQ